MRQRRGAGDPPARGLQVDGRCTAPCHPARAQVFPSCWIALHGAVIIGVFGHPGFARDDAEPMFDLLFAGLGRRLAL